MVGIEGIKNLFYFMFAGMGVVVCCKFENEKARKVGITGCAVFAAIQFIELMWRF